MANALTYRCQGDASSVTYNTGNLEVDVSRSVTDGFFTETYTFRNISGNAVQVDSLGIFTPFNDNYPDVRTCATNRCNAHIWAGLNSSYVNAIRMDGVPSHLGLVFTKGSMESYSLENRGLDGGSGYKASNVRGTIIMNIHSFKLKANESYTVQWKMFWHGGWEVFFATAKKLGFVKLGTDRYVVGQNERMDIKVDAKMPLKEMVIADTKVLGEHSLIVPYGDNQSTRLNYLVISSPEKIINQRVHFIVGHQQMDDTSDGRYGAYMVYDNGTGKILTDTRNATAASDKDEGREPVGMGVMIAKWLQGHEDPVVYGSLARYVAFVRNKLQTPDYKVYSDVLHTHKNRGYNYPWVADLYLQMYYLTKKAAYLKDSYSTLQRFFKEFGHQFYAIGIPVKESLDGLKKEGLAKEYDSLLSQFRSMGDNLVKNGIYYPKSEVNYEQSIVAPSVIFLLELYSVTREERYLAAAKIQMPSLEAFQGRQPDVHLN